MHIDYFKNHFNLHLPVFSDGQFWNGRPDEFNNLKYNLDYSQEFGMTPYAKTGVYGTYNGKPRPHNGHDFCGCEGTPLCAGIRAFITFIGNDPKGYGNYVFYETETIKENGSNLKMEFVLAHCKEILTKPQKWVKSDEIIALLGTTGMSTGFHTHHGGRPLEINPDGSTKWAIPENGSRGYIDLTDFYIEKPVYNKQELINSTMKLIKKKGTTDIYALTPDGKANLILNWETYQIGLESKLWISDVNEVNELPALGNIIILAKNN